MPGKKIDINESVGKRIKKIRMEQKVSLENLAGETGLSLENLKKIESGKSIPPVGALLQIAKALRIDSGFLLREHENRRQSRIEAYVKRTENYAYTTLTPGAENKHLKAFKITVEAQTPHKGVGYQHEGEEFVYVLQGRVEIAVGENVTQLSAGESLHFNSGIRHRLENIGSETAELLVVIYNP